VNRASAILLLLCTSASAVAAQILLKAAINSLEQGDIRLVRRVLATVVSWQFLLAVFLVGVSGTLWVILMTRGVALSAAFPILVGTSCLLIVIVGGLGFGEQIQLSQVAGALMIVGGAFLMLVGWR